MAGALFTHCGYGAGHPWFYFLGAPVLAPKEIRAEVRSSGYCGYMADDIRQADNRPEPQRSKSLRDLRDEVLREFWRDMSRYREIARELHRYRKMEDVERRPNACADVHTSMSLKHNHLYNHFAHLLMLEEALTRQGDLFDL